MKQLPDVSAIINDTIASWHRERTLEELTRFIEQKLSSGKLSLETVESFE